MANLQPLDLSGSDLIVGSIRTSAQKLGQLGARYFLGNGTAPASSNNAGNNTITAANILTGIYVRDCNGAGRTDTLDTAAAIVAAIRSATSTAAIGDILYLDVINGTNGAFSVTIAAGTGGAFDANQSAASRVVQQNSSKCMSLRLTNVTAGSEAYVVYC
jgi:hypothetical protein